MTTKDQALREAREALDDLILNVTEAMKTGGWVPTPLHKSFWQSVNDAQKAVMVADAALSEKAEPTAAQLMTAIRLAGLTVARTVRGYSVMKLGEVRAQQSADDQLFELWWAEYMPDATQDRAWKAWTAAPRADGVGVVAHPTQQPEERHYNCRVYPHGEVPCDQCEPRTTQQPEAVALTDSMGIPLSCGKPLCSPNDHHPLCHMHAQQPEAQGEPIEPNDLTLAYMKGYSDGKAAQQPAPQPVEPLTIDQRVAIAEAAETISDDEIMRHWNRRDDALEGRNAVIWFARAVIGAHLTATTQPADERGAFDVLADGAEAVAVEAFNHSSCGGHASDLYKLPMRVKARAALSQAPQAVTEKVVNADYRDMWAEQVQLNQRLNEALAQAPQTREWRELTDEEIDAAVIPLGFAQLTPREVARAISAALKSANGGGV